MEQNTEPIYYEETIDLRAMVETLLRWAWLIVLAGLLAAGAAYLTSKLVLSPQYESTALVAITEPGLVADLEPSIQVSPQMPDTKAMADLAQADDLLLSVYQSSAVRELLEDEANFSAFRSKAEAALVGNNQLRLTVTDSDPQRVARIANVWAEQVVIRLNSLYGSSEVSFAQLEQQVETARQNWDAAQAALEAYLPESRVSVLAVQVAQAESALGLNLQKLDQNELLVLDAQAIQKRLDSQSGTDLLSTGDVLSLITLQQRAVASLQEQESLLGGDGDLSGSVSIQYMLTGEGVLAQAYTVAQAQDALDALIGSLESQREELETRLEEKESRLSASVTDLEAEEHKRNQLVEERDLARKAYLALAAQLGETRITAASSGQAAKVAAQAWAPENPSGPNTKMNTALAGVVGLMLAVGVVFVVEWWREEPEDRSQGE